LAELGARRWVMPVELGAATLERLQAARPAGLETEVFAYGRLPLAFSARCFTARAHNVPKDQCDLRCLDYPEGLALDTQEGNGLFTINGIQLQSQSPSNLIEADSELGTLKRICANGRYPVEANDMGAVRLLSGQTGFIAGPHINCYNPGTLALLAELGARRWVLPVELGAATLERLQAARPVELETEVFGYGRLPLAFSARCFTARAHNVPKDQCELRCVDYPEGLALDTQEGKGLFTINGIQLQSQSPSNLIEALPALQGLAVDVVRISPEGLLAGDTGRVVAAFRQVLDQAISPQVALQSLPAPAAGWCNGYWHGSAGMDWTALVETSEL
jgi:collagenase-like PrtC family protease